MSYNYDINPWDDNYNPNQVYNNDQTQASGYSGAQSGGDYSASQSSNRLQGAYQDQYQYGDEQQAGSYETGYQEQVPAEDTTGDPGKNSGSGQRSGFGGFLRQHVPILGSIMDTVSAINLPFIDALLQHVNRDLLVSKMFYFFFYSAFGSLFPLMGVYFKQLGMNPAQVGILTGVRPFIEIFSAPFWSGLADRFQKSKALLLFSLLSWIIFTYSLAHIHPPASACVAFNDSEFLLYTPYSNNELSYINVDDIDPEGHLKPNSSPEEQEKQQEANRMEQTESPNEILAKEESENEQRRRRKRRSIENHNQSPGSRYVYSIEGPGDELKDELELDMDLESDFDDTQIDQGHQRLDQRRANHQTDNDGYYGAEYGDHSTNQPRTRSRRAASDDLFGGGGEELPPEEEQEEESEERPRSSANRKDKVKSQKVKSRGPADEEVEGEKEDERQEAAKETDNEMDSGDANNGADVRRDKKLKDSSQRSKESYEVKPTEEATILTEANKNQDTAKQDKNNDGQPQVAASIAGQPNKRRVFRQRHKTPPTHIVGKSPITVEYAVNYKKEKHSQYVTPMFSTIVYKLDDIKEVFFLLLLLISLGEFFSAPALTIADSATLAYLGDNTDLYGRQRMFGSLSWAITLLLVGMALDNATFIADHPCGPHQRERSYNVCFIIFSLLMACALLTATQFTFNYQAKGLGKSATKSESQTVMTSASVDSKSATVVTTNVETAWSSTGNSNIDDLYASTQPRSIFNTAPPVNAPPPTLAKQNQEQKFEFLDKWKSAVFAQRTGQLPEWVNVFRQFRNSLHLTYLFITWFLGCGVGLVFTFLFWHLQDVGGTPTLFGICSVINHISEILAYFFSFNFIKRYGHTRVLSVGLGCNVIRFLYVAFLNDPYYALPFELVQGITHAACFAACCSYISHVSKPELRTSTQGVMQGLHHGIGRACGALIGGYMINAIGSRASFCIYGLLSGCVLAGFLYIRKRVSESEDEQDVKVDDSEALGGYGAPQGVPTAVL